MSENLQVTLISVLILVCAWVLLVTMMAVTG